MDDQAILKTLCKFGQKNIVWQGWIKDIQKKLRPNNQLNFSDNYLKKSIDTDIRMMLRDGYTIAKIYNGSHHHSKIQYPNRIANQAIKNFRRSFGLPDYPF